jgi:hypothetical protein
LAVFHRLVFLFGVLMSSLFKLTALYIIFYRSQIVIFDTLHLAMCIQTGTMGNPKSHI